MAESSEDGRRHEVQPDHVIGMENVIDDIGQGSTELVMKMKNVSDDQVQGGVQQQTQGDHNSTNHRSTGTHAGYFDFEISRAARVGNWDHFLDNEVEDAVVGQAAMEDIDHQEGETPQRRRAAFTLISAIEGNWKPPKERAGNEHVIHIDNNNNVRSDYEIEAVASSAAITVGELDIDDHETAPHWRHRICLAAMEGNWEAAKEMDSTNIDFNARVAVGGKTLLDVAVWGGQANFVAQLVQEMSDVGLNHRDSDGDSALSNAAMAGVKAVAEAIIGKKRDLLMARGEDGRLPIYWAAAYGHKEMVNYLYSLHTATGDRDHLLEDMDLADLCCALIEADIHDIALEILNKEWERLATTKTRNGDTILHVVARNPDFLANQVPSSFEALWRFFNPGSLFAYNKAQKKNLHRKLVIRNICERVASSKLNDKGLRKLFGDDWDPLFLAAEQGNVEFIRILVRTFPSILFIANKNMHTIFHIAVLTRHVEIFKLIHEIGPTKNAVVRFTNAKGNGILHMAGMLAPLPQLNVVPGAALQIQQELLWFEEVKKVVGPRLAKLKNKSGKTADEVFMAAHQGLIRKGEEWMRNTANSCLIVATLVATVAFAAAFTVPGGNDQNTGFPMFLNKTLFKIFAVSDAISLVFSVTSVLTFLSLLTSTYQLEDFARSLPTKLLVGITTLFVSIAAMMVAFVTVFFVYFRHHQLLTYAVPVAVVAFVPICLFIVFHSRLFVNVIKSTYTQMWNSPFLPNNKDPLFPAPKKNKKA